MKRILSALAGLFILMVTGCNTNQSICEADKKMKKIEITKDSTIVCFGDSLTYGHGADSSTESWPARLQERVNIPVVNAGVDSDNTTDGLNRFSKDVLENNPAILIIDFGGNDIYYLKKKNSYKQIERNFRSMLDQIDFSKTEVFVMRFYNDEMRFLDLFGIFDRILKRLSNDYDITIIWDAWKNAWGHSDCKYDMSHCNAKGYKIMEENIFEIIRPSLEENGLLK